MNEFVEQCRHEWRRLGVSPQLADEMAAEVAADLAEAGAESVPAEQLVGADARSFAADWAVARGVVRRRRRAAWMPVAIMALALIAIVGAVLVLRDPPSSRATIGPILVAPSGQSERVVVVARAAEARLVAAQVQSSVAASSSGDRSDTRTAGAVILFVALGAIIVLMLSCLWLRGRATEPRPAD